MLPVIRPSSSVWAETEADFFGRPIPIAGVAGDQQAAMFGQACFAPGEAKNTYGTGRSCSRTSAPRRSQRGHGLLSTVLWRLGDGRRRPPTRSRAPCSWPAPRSSGCATACGPSRSAEEVEALMRGVEDTGGVYLVPAFVGLGAPYWDPRARGLLIGLTRGTGLPEIARATIESIAYQVERRRRGDGGRSGRRRSPSCGSTAGAARNDDLLRFQADILGIPVERPRGDRDDRVGCRRRWPAWRSGSGRRSTSWRRSGPSTGGSSPPCAAPRRTALLAGWHRAVERSRDWAVD